MGNIDPPKLSRTARGARAGRCGSPSEIEGGPHRLVTLVDGVQIAIDAREPIDARIGSIAARQRGRVARRQLLAAGISSSAIDRRLGNGRLGRVHAGVYALPHTEELPLSAETGALLACGRGAVLSHHSACTLWGLRPGAARPVHVTVPGGGGFPAPAGVRVHRCRTLSSSDVDLHERLPVTSVARTFLDVAATLPERDLERLLDDARFARRLVTPAQLEAVLARAGGHPGRGRLARVVRGHTRSTRTDSRPEEKLFRLIRAAGLPEPLTQVPMLGYRLDFFWPNLQLAVEVDAYGTHGSAARFEADRRRDARLLTENGISTLRLTRTAIEQRPAEALGVVARAIGQRESR